MMSLVKLRKATIFNPRGRFEPPQECLCQFEIPSTEDCISCSNSGVKGKSSVVTGM